MSCLESARLAELSRAVRQSSLKRLRLVSANCVNWRPTPEAMSFADIAQHLIDVDEWLFKMLELKNLKPIRGRVRQIEIGNRAEYTGLLDRLAEIGEKRADFIGKIDSAQLSELIYDERFGEEVTVWWIIVRGNLDHEIHHRGQIATYLRMLKNMSDSRDS